MVIGAVVAAGIKLWPERETAHQYQLTPARIQAIRSIVRLATVEIVRDAPVRARAGSRHLVGSMTLTGEITFDLDRMNVSMSGDTLIVSIPSPDIILRESTAPGSYKVYDTWNDYPLLSAALTTVEENRAKQAAIAAERQRLIEEGTVENARRNAVESVIRLLGNFYQGPAVIKSSLPRR